VADDRPPPDELEARLTALRSSIAWPSSADLAGAVGARLARPAQRRGWWTSVRPVRRALLAAAALVLLLAATVAALSFLVPGLRILQQPSGATLPPVATPSVSPGSPLGFALGLGSAAEPEVASDVAGFELLLPTDPSIGPPDETYAAQRRISLLWRASEALPETEAPGVGLIVTQFRGLVDEGWYEKIVITGETTVERVDVAGGRGWWVSGEPHQLVYRDESGRAVEETRRVVGDVLIWRQGDITIRIESSLGQAATIRLAETFAAP
jgi:hypothetical protein